MSVIPNQENLRYKIRFLSCSRFFIQWPMYSDCCRGCAKCKLFQDKM